VRLIGPSSIFDRIRRSSRSIRRRRGRTKARRESNLVGDRDVVRFESRSDAVSRDCRFDVVREDDFRRRRFVVRFRVESIDDDFVPIVASRRRERKIDSEIRFVRSAIDRSRFVRRIESFVVPREVFRSSIVRRRAISIRVDVRRIDSRRDVASLHKIENAISFSVRAARESDLDFELIVDRSTDRSRSGRRRSRSRSSIVRFANFASRRRRRRRRSTRDFDRRSTFRRFEAILIRDRSFAIAIA